MFSSRKISAAGFSGMRTASTGNRFFEAAGTINSTIPSGKQEAYQRSEAAPWSGRRGFSFLYRFQRALRPQENVCLFAGSEGDEPGCAGLRNCRGHDAAARIFHAFGNRTDLQ